MTRQEKKAIKQLLIELLQFFAQNINKNGFNYNPKKIANILGIKESTLRKYIGELKKEGIIERTGNYETGKHSQRIRFLIDPPSITRGTLLAIEKSKIIDKSPNEIEIKNPIYDKLLNEIDKFVELNNKWSLLRIFNACRYVQWETGNTKIRKHIDFKGRVYSNLSFTKSMKEGKEYKDTDYRLSRADMLKEMGLENYVEIYDICSEVPRITAVFNGIHTFNEIKDYYTYLIQKAGISITREGAKKLFMRCYFEKSDKAAWRNFTNNEDFKEYPISKNDFLAFFEATKKELKPLGNFVFILTSYIEQVILHEFREFKMVNVYDGFYSNYRLGGKINKFLNENCGRLLNEFGGKDKDHFNQEYINQDHCNLGYNNQDHINQDHDLKNIFNNKYPICDTNLEEPSKKDLLICDTNLEPRKKRIELKLNPLIILYADRI
jgi:DNA-binding Lrp family transcriptional regulator